MTLRICSSLDIEEALTRAFEYLGKFIPADTISLSYVDTDNRHMFPVAMVAREGFTALWDELFTPVPLDDEFLQFVLEKETQDHFISTYNSPNGLPEAVIRCFPDLKSRSSIGINLMIRDEQIGVLIISADGLNRYTTEHTALLESIKEPIALAMSNTRRYTELKRVKDLLDEDNRSLIADFERVSGSEVIGGDFGLREVMEMVRRVAPSGSPAQLLGETGTGKEIIANAIHMASPRRDGPMIRMQCGAIPETLLDSELFGHEKGAFTGASERKRGRFERANGGTLFLDEIGELSLDAQVKFLRVLQEKQFERVGGIQTISVDTRVIAATHRDLEQMVQDGLFREDLWYRLNILPIRIPPLRLRRDDIPSMALYFVQRKAHEMNLEITPQIDESTMERLKKYDWPGNVRELQNIVERALILSQGNVLSIPPLAPLKSRPQQNAVTDATTIQTMDEAIAEHIRRTLEQTNGRVAGSDGAAKILQMNPSTLRFRMKRLGITLSKTQRSLT